MNEFELIARYLAPLAGEGAFGLTDDAALHHGLVVTKDLMVDGVHFRTEDGWDAAAQKTLRANISDLVAKGAVPDGVLLGMVWPKGVTEAQIARFCEGLATDLRAYGLTLLGGDTTKHRVEGAPLTVSITMTGRPGPKGPVLRSGAKRGDALFVTGTIGDGGLGLHTLLEGKADYPQAVEFYLRPTLPVALAPAIGRLASAALDVSDGLVADAGHMAAQSKLALDILAEAVPLSDEAKAWRAAGGDLATLLCAGDDYQTLMAVPPENVASLTEEAKRSGVRLTRLGEVRDGEPKVRVLADDGTPMGFGAQGFSHF